MKKKVWLIALAIILVIAIIAAVVVGIVLNLNKEEESTGTKWGDTYYAYLKEAINQKDLKEAEEKYGIMLDMEDAKIQFCEVEQDQDPTMIMTYKKNGSSYVNVYQINEKKKVNYIAYKQPTEVEYLYDIAKEEYSWYVHTAGTDKESYCNLKNISDTLKGNSNPSKENDDVNVAEFEADYTIVKSEAEISAENADGETISYSKFDEIFVKPDIKLNKEIEFSADMKEKDLKESMTDAVDEYKKDSKRITDEVEKKVLEQVEETKKKIEEVNKAIEDNRIKKEEEEKKKAEEEEKKKGLKVGGYTLKYGKYIGLYAVEGGYFELNADGTCTIAWSGSSPNKYTYKIEQYNFAQGVQPLYKEGICLYNSNGTKYHGYFPTSSTEITDGDIECYVYQGESSSSSTTSSNNNGSSQNNKLTKYEYDESANDPIPAGTYYRGKGTGAESVLEIKNPTKNSFNFSLDAIYMTSSGYPNVGDISGTAKAIKGGGYVFHITEGALEYNVFFRTAGGASNLTITIQDECYNTKDDKMESIMPYCGHNVTFQGTYSR